MIPIFTICMVIFIIVLKINISKNDRAKEDTMSKFWEREHQANFTRKQDISGLDYITIPLDKFPLNLGTEAETSIKELANCKILNLTGISNTDLKLMYGVANLEVLTQYDNNFTLLVNALSTYGKELIDAEKIDEAKNVLEYAVSIKADAKQIFVLLAKIYQDANEPDRILSLIHTAEELNSFSRNTILSALKEIQERPNVE